MSWTFVYVSVLDVYLRQCFESLFALVFWKFVYFQCFECLFTLVFWTFIYVSVSNVCLRQCFERLFTLVFRTFVFVSVLNVCLRQCFESFAISVMTSSEEQRVCIKFSFKLFKTATETHAMLVDAAPASEVEEQISLQFFSCWVHRTKCVGKLCLINLLLPWIYIIFRLSMMLHILFISRDMCITSVKLSS